jgi:hypothetical protein
MMVSCVYKTKTEIEESKRLNGFYVIVIDSCEYLGREVYIGNQIGQFAHKGNCKYCAKRHKQELKELVEQLKDK